MIIYFSGTGNSKFVAEKISEICKDELFDMKASIKNNETPELYSDKAYVIVAPTYAWRLPRIVTKWLLKAKLEGNDNIYFVLTCGADIGHADKYAKRIAKRKSMKYRGCGEIVMPENYIALFNTPNRREAMRIVRVAERQIRFIGRTIGRKMPLVDRSKSPLDLVKSGMTNRLFYATVVKSKKFCVKDDCNGCGKCVQLCPLNNIKIENGHPLWGNRCTHCMACICLCPQEAVEYGKKSVGKPRYKCPEDL